MALHWAIVACFFIMGASGALGVAPKLSPILTMQLAGVGLVQYDNNKQLMFITANHSVFTYEAQNLDESADRLNVTGVKLQTFQKAFPSLVLKWSPKLNNEFHINHVIMVKGSYLIFGGFLRSISHVYVENFYGISDSSYQPLSNLPLSRLEAKVWISAAPTTSSDNGTFFIWEEEKKTSSTGTVFFQLSLSKKNLIIDGNNTLQGVTDETSYKICVNNDQTITVVKDKDCGQSGLENPWNVKKGFATQKRFYLFSNSTVYAFESSALDSDRNTVPLTKKLTSEFFYDYQPTTTVSMSTNSSTTEKLYNKSSKVTTRSSTAIGSTTLLPMLFIIIGGTVLFICVLIVLLVICSCCCCWCWCSKSKETTQAPEPPPPAPKPESGGQPNYHSVKPKPTNGTNDSSRTGSNRHSSGTDWANQLPKKDKKKTRKTRKSRRSRKSRKSTRKSTRKSRKSSRAATSRPADTSNKSANKNSVKAPDQVQKIASNSLGKVTNQASEQAKKIASLSLSKVSGSKFQVQPSTRSPNVTLKKTNSVVKNKSHK